MQIFCRTKQLFWRELHDSHIQAVWNFFVRTNKFWARRGTVREQNRITIWFMTIHTFYVKVTSLSMPHSKALVAVSLCFTSLFHGRGDITRSHFHQHACSLFAVHHPPSRSSGDKWRVPSMCACMPLHRFNICTSSSTCTRSLCLKCSNIRPESWNFWPVFFTDAARDSSSRLGKRN